MDANQKIVEGIKSIVEEEQLQVTPEIQEQENIQIQQL